MSATFGNIPSNEQEYEIAKQYDGLMPEEVQTLDFVNPKNAGGTTGSGTYLVGSYRGKNYDEFRKNALGLIQARTGIEELKRISEKPAESLSFEDSNRANKIQTYIMADMKSDIVGNQVTEEEWKRLEKYIADPTKIFTFEGAERRGYDIVLSKLNSAIGNLSTGSGIKVIQSKNSGQSVEQITSQNKIASRLAEGQ
jgi:ERCC4-type nuclease